MPKGHFILGCLVLAGCASTKSAGDLPLQNPDLSARLSVADNLPPLPGGGSYLAVPGYIFVADQLVMHPGVKRVAYSCPGDWPWRRISDFVPSVEQDFQAGHQYELYCEDGYPKIRLVK